MPIYHLALRGPLHAGEAVSIDRETVLDWLPSDSLFSAIVTAWAQTGIDVQTRLAAFDSAEVPFRLTSAFPWVAGIRFFPAPAALPTVPGLEGKRAKKVRWLSAGVLAHLCNGTPPAADTDSFLHDGKVWLTAEERQSIPPALTDEDGKVRLWRTFIVPRVAVDRVTNASNLFHAGRVSFPAGSGLWFAARGPHKQWVGEGLKFLMDSGLGGLRNYGHGAFTFVEVADDLPREPTSGAGLCLSRYAPMSEDEIRATIQHRDAVYRLVTVGGWCADDSGQGWRRRVVRLLAEGALIPDVTAAHGSLIKVEPEIPAFAKRHVYRSALPFFVDAGRLSAAKEVPA